MSGADRYDLAVIGSGPAGEKGAAQAAYFSKRVALIERAPHLGGAGGHGARLQPPLQGAGVAGATPGRLHHSRDRHGRAVRGGQPLVHIGGQAMAGQGTIDAFIDAVYSYPTLSDSYKYAAYDWLDRWQAWRRARRPGA